ncbi:hypothetical protein PENNAL_c0008G11083 [Penicillium nalgiovense]|uniref:Uncharacterized protein n=1 Tax=Penicillium nalgiovense TaxID=60175 RepID=A0A1V6YWJ8_PENNA|nr:hypothetical protein PENNAL_c0008G11083 [Penicillium nalgiovense]
MTSFFLRGVQHKAAGMSNPQKKLQCRCTAGVIDLPTTILDCDPIYKDRLRYAARKDLPKSDTLLDHVNGLAELLSELALDPNHPASVYGAHISSQLKKCGKYLGINGNNMRMDPTYLNSTTEVFDARSTIDYGPKLSD